ncbi:GTPase SAR1 family protein [Pseudomonas synxantha]|uniref:Labile enterotoxin output A n=1 Tax=Pseudomonas synxantha TaxID=47883 RepID=A0AAX3IHY7_9PSED|nr:MULTISPECIES: LeoA/HP0731 family dynamin-like GTPase [Pseudomonas]KRP49381.1 labile enterotoxin output A [Pseudomonas synxantha]OMQ40249.1 labile enterotoxin output A [Pseudomonas putida]SDU58638.1 GTPase SAR1 family protein [Pseudomonas synxantha]VTR05045.1 labile enterotoxin output A [Pseudomonas synxantha]
MNSTLELFLNQNNKALALLDKLRVFLEKGTALGVNIDPTLLSKLEHASQNLANDKLKIALIGGFSEGKTSIAAAWMERLDKSSMNISQQESSNEVKVYEVDDNFVLIDTPGLFGFKEQFNADINAMEKYKDITRKYVSEAHLVLYVMNSTNPIKDSHKDDLNWLFRTLDLLPRTVFVLSRFDEVADVEDEASYAQHLQVKRSNVESRLRESIGASDAEVAALSIVAVAANPFDMGTDYWLERIEQFKTLSHINNLQQATAGKIQSSGGSAVIVEQARKSVILDVLHKELPVAVENDQRLGEEVERLSGVSRTLSRQLDSAKGQIGEVRIGLREFVTRYFSGLIMRTEGLTQETFKEFFEREIGRDGVMVTTRLQNEFDRQLNGVSQELSRMRLSFDSEIDHFNTNVINLGKQGVNYVIKGNLINNGTILAARDGIVSVAKTLGVDLGKALKFKPWGAVNLAKNLNGILSVAGLALEAWDSYERKKREDQFRQAIAEMVDNFNNQREELLNMIQDVSFEERFFPDYASLDANAADVQVAIDTQKKLREQFREWRQTGELIEAEFTRIEG